MRLLQAPGIRRPRPGRGTGASPFPEAPSRFGGLPGPPRPSLVFAFAPFLPTLHWACPGWGLGISHRQASARLNLLQKVGGEQPHLAAGVDLDVAAGFIAFLHHNLNG